MHAGSGDGNIYALTEEGKIVWKFPTGVSNYMVSVDSQKVYFGTFSGELIALDKYTGSPLWKKKLSDARIVAYPAIFREKIAIGTEDGKFFVLNKNTGSIIFNTIWDL